MIDSLFPHGNIVVFLMLFVLFMIGSCIGPFVATAPRGRRGISFSLMIMAGLICSFLFYHFIGTFTFQ